MKNLLRSTVMVLCLCVLSMGCAGVGTEGDAAASNESQEADFFGSESYTLPANTPVQVRLQTNIVGDTANVEQAIKGEVISDVVVNGHVLIPAGTLVNGTVTAVKPAKRFGGQAMVAVGFDSVTLPSGDSVPVEGSMAAYAHKETAKDTGTIIGGTVGGAILGRVIGNDSKDAVAGAVIGGGIGTAIASRKGDEAHLPAGTTTTVQTTRALELPEA